MPIPTILPMFADDAEGLAAETRRAARLWTALLAALLLAAIVAAGSI